MDEDDVVIAACAAVIIASSRQQHVELRREMPILILTTHMLRLSLMLGKRDAYFNCFTTYVDVLNKDIAPRLKSKAND